MAQRRLSLLVVLTLAGALLAATPVGATTSRRPQRCSVGAPQTGVPDQQFWDLFTQYGPGWTGADSTYSVKLPDGRTAWIFSDTFLGTVNPDRSRPADSPLINNSIVVQNGNQLTTVHGGTTENPTSLFAPTDGSSWYWAYDGEVEGNKLRIFLIKFTRFGPGPWDWRWSGTDVATLSLPDLRVRQIVPVEADNGVAYGAYVRSDRRHTYIYGLEDLGLSKLGHVARTPKGHLLDQDQWEFWTGDQWSSDPSQTAPMLNDSISNEYSVTKAGDGYVMITMDTSVPLDQWRDIVAYTSCSPQGPWTNRTVVYQAPEADDPELWPYNPHAHPQFTRRGELLVSYNVNSSDFSSLFEDADRYRARFIRVRVPGVQKH
jgi:hypothetical protein